MCCLYIAPALVGLACSSSSSPEVSDAPPIDGAVDGGTDSDGTGNEGTDGDECPIARPATCVEAAWSDSQVGIANTSEWMPDQEVTALAAAGCGLPSEPTCEDACDCRFLRIACGGIATAVHRCYPYGFAYTLYLEDEGSECGGGDGCDMIDELPPDKYELVCVEGRCQVVSARE